MTSPSWPTQIVTATSSGFQATAKRAYFKYWASVYAGKYPDWDDFQINLANFHNNAKPDPAKREKHLDDQFAKKFKPGDKMPGYIKTFQELVNAGRVPLLLVTPESMGKLEEEQLRKELA